MVGTVIKALVARGLTFDSSDDFENDFSPYPETIEDHEVFIGDDGERDQWEVTLRVTPKDGVDLHEVVVSVLGPPTRDIARGDGIRITNFEPEKVLVVVGDGEVMFYQDYKKS